MDAGEVAIAVLAAGNARRFGSDKLMAHIDGRPLGLLAAERLAALPTAGHIAVCQTGADIAAAFATLGYVVVENPDPGKGLSGSLHLALEAAGHINAKALLIVLADMPFVQAEHVQKLIDACDWDIVASSDGDQNMPPAIFPVSTWPELGATNGDSGARHLLSSARMLMAPHGMLRDIDTPDDLAASKAPPHHIDQAI